MKLNGIDVSSHNETINWAKAVEQVDFVMIRAGYGKNNIDSYLIKNVTGCKNYSIPFGFYWFSYALSKDMAAKEADYVCDLADKYHPALPIAYDWEYDSDNYALHKGVNITANDRADFARTFLSRVKKRGYTPMLYTNVDYINKGFNAIIKTYDIWLAQWGVKTPSYKCAIWQSSETGKISGINGYVDINTAYKDYSVSDNNSTNNESTKIKLTDKNKAEIITKLGTSFWEKYLTLAVDIIKGKYGNGNDRKKKLQNIGCDYDIAQTFVNYLIGNGYK